MSPEDLPYTERLFRGEEMPFDVPAGITSKYVGRMLPRANMSALSKPSLESVLKAGKSSGRLEKDVPKSLEKAVQAIDDYDALAETSPEGFTFTSMISEADEIKGLVDVIKPLGLTMDQLRALKMYYKPGKLDFNLSVPPSFTIAAEADYQVLKKAVDLVMGGIGL